MRRRDTIKEGAGPQEKPQVVCYCCGDTYSQEKSIYAEFSIYNYVGMGDSDHGVPSAKMCQPCAELYVSLIENHERLLEVYPDNVEMEEL